MKDSKHSSLRTAVLAGALAVAGLTGLTDCTLKTQIIEFNVDYGKLECSLEGDYNIISVGKDGENKELFYASKDFSALLGTGDVTPDGKIIDGSGILSNSTKPKEIPLKSQKEYEDYHNKLVKYSRR